MLALSNSSYDTFVDGDLSAFSKKYVVLPFDPHITGPINDTSLEHPYNTNYKYDNSLVKYYLEYVKSGGNLIIMDSEYNYDSLDSRRGLFSKLLSINPDDFTSSIEKKYGNGKVIFVNTAEYFDNISKESPQGHNNNKNNSLDFMTLRNISGVSHAYNRCNRGSQIQFEKYISYAKLSIKSSNFRKFGGIGKNNDK